MKKDNSKKTELGIISGSFNKLVIDFSEKNHASVFFAHLQNVLKEFNVQPTQELQFNKIDHVLYDIYMEYLSLEHGFEQATNSIRDMAVLMKDVESVMKQSQSDREELLKVSEDRQKIMEKLKEATDFSI